MMFVLSDRVIAECITHNIDRKARLDGNLYLYPFLGC